MAAKNIPIYTTSSCQCCDRLDTDEMVACDKCDLWFHFDCVGVDGSVANRDWKCDICKYAVPAALLNRTGKENVPANAQWRKPRSVRTLTSISSDQSKVLALQRLEEERTLNARRDQEYLRKKYSILEGSLDEFIELGEGEHNVSSEYASLKNTQRWAEEVQQLSVDFTNKFAANDLSISVTEVEKAKIDKGFRPLATSSTNVNRKLRVRANHDEIRQTNPFSIYVDPVVSEHSPPRIAKVRSETREVDRPLQTGPNSTYVTKNAEPLFGENKVNPIRPAKLQFGPQSSSASNPNFGHLKCSTAAHTKTTFSNAMSKPCTVDNPSRHNLRKFGHDEFNTSTYRSASSTFGEFGFPSVQSQANLLASGQDDSHQLGSIPTARQTTTHLSTSNQIASAQPVQIQPANQTSSSLAYIPHQLVDYNELCKSEVNLTSGQIATRHTMDKKYPHFYGEPAKWQMFESAFVNVTKSCGLNNAENLSRLQECLKGDAMDVVKCRLLHPNNVPGVMDTLRLMFGRPDLVIDTLLEEIDNTPAPAPEDLVAFVKFAVLVQNLSSTVVAFNSIEHLRNPLTLKKLVAKLPAQISMKWACYRSSIADANIATFSTWIYALAAAVTDVIPTTIAKKARQDNSKAPKSDNYVNSTNSNTTACKSAPVTSTSGAVPKNQKKCPACNRDICKKLDFCEKFKKSSRQERWKLVKNNNLCGCCLGNHRYFNCKQKVQCGVAGCGFFHHVLLHNDSKDASEKANTKFDNSSKRGHDDDIQKKTCNAISGMPGQLQYPEIFRIVPVQLLFDGQSLTVFAYFDDGSNLTTMESSVAQKLGLIGTRESLCVKWSFGDAQLETESSRISVEIRGIQDDAETFLLDDVRTVKQLQLPSQSITASWLKQHSYFNGIPIATYDNATPQIIIGLRYSTLMVSLETIEGDWGQPIVCRTRLGWVVQGPNDKRISTESKLTYSLNMCDCQALYHSLHQLVKEFFSLETFGVRVSERIIESKSLTRARNIMETSVVKVNSHYETALLWRSDDIRLPSSFDMAMRRLECVESKMKKNPILAERMCDYLKDFLDKGYIRKLTSSERQIHGPHTWYMPIFPVFNPKKPDKLRLVWDGAAKVNGVSLNSQLLVGPDQLIPLPDILRRFREARIGLSTDIIEMYHRIYVKEEDQDAQRFLWRDGDVSRKPDVFVVKVLPFGLTCSPAIAQFVKNKNAQSFQQQYPKAVEAITQNHYVDDMIERAHDVESAVKLIKDVQFIHRHANFDLRNLVSNDRQVLEAINGSTEFSDKILTNKLDLNIERILGMFWNTTTDTFTYSLQFVKLQTSTSERRPTKREVLRIIMSVFDPLGFLTHLLTHAKVLLQEIWRTNITWDVQIPPSLAIKWSRWVHHLVQVETLHIPRLYSSRLSPQSPKSLQLHVFVDASLETYATVAYFRIENDNGVDSCLIGGKSRVAPLKPISVPRLELQGGLLGNRFAESILHSHSGLHIEKTIIWCDSKTVLFWLSTEPRRYSQFVAFRIGEILDSTINAEWRWIPSEFNVADDATKTKDLPVLHSSSRWFQGPEFLRDANADFSFELDEPDFTTDDEVRPYYLLTHVEVPVSKLIDYERFSNWQRLMRAMAYVLRFIRNAKLERQRHCLGALSNDELLAAENRLLSQAQYDCFREEISIVRWNQNSLIDQHKSLDKTSIIRNCSPYLDDVGVLRVMGRIDNAKSISDSARRPIILARDHYITRLIVYWYHRKYRHLHHQTVLNEIRQKFWIPKLRVVLNTVRNSCQKCKNTAAVPRIPEMGAIPRERLATYTRCFSFVGIDYFGPIKVIVNRGTQKRWGALFTCLTTRAVHLEIAHSMDTSSCIMSIRNFIGRRGTPLQFHVDNGTNFHGADNALREEIAKLDKSRIQDEFSTSAITWSFNPPTAAHMGGIWERMVGLVKKCLDEILTVRYPTDEMLTSLFIEIENMLNSRPLTYVSLESPHDEVLTPNHFLLGSSSGSKPPGYFTDADLLRNNWKAVQAMTDKFWQKFVDEYVPTLTIRSKWHAKVNPIKVGDVVLIADPGFLRNTWPKGIVVETFMDRTGQVRSARARTATGTIFRRPVSHLAKLDVVEPGLVKLDHSIQLTGPRMFDNTA